MNQTPTAEIITATKDIVDKLLSINTKNRKIKQSHIDYLKNEILNKQYELTSQGIGVTANGVLCDGQHRLMAIREAGYPPVKILIVSGLSDTAQIKTDIGSKRTVADLLTIYLNQSISGLLVAAINLIVRVSEGTRKLSPEDISNRLVEYNEEISALQKIEGFGRVNAPVYAAFIYSLNKTRDKRVLDFARQVATGELLAKDDPAFVLRAYLESCPKGLNGGQVVQEDRFGKTLYAIDKFLKGEKISRVYKKELPSKVEEFLNSRFKSA